MVLLYTVGAAGAGYVYLRLFKGWRLGDLMYVTRSSLSKSMNSVTAGLCFFLHSMHPLGFSSVFDLKVLYHVCHFYLQLG